MVNRPPMFDYNNESNRLFVLCLQGKEPVLAIQHEGLPRFEHVVEEDMNSYGYSVNWNEM